MDKHNETELNKLPVCAAEFIKLVIKKMRYRRKVRRDVQAELAAHFEDELRGCKTDEEKEQNAQRLIEQFGEAKLLGILLRRAKKRCRPLWRTVVARTFQAIGVLILCLIAYAVWFFTGKPAITTDYLTEFNRITCPAADESLNAAPFFEQAAAVCPNRPDEKSDFWGKSYFDANETERQVISDWVQLCSDSLNLITKGTERPYYWRQYKTSGEPDDDGSMLGVLFPHLPEFRKLALAFRFRAQIKATKGEYPSAFNNLITSYKFGRLVGQGEKTIIEQLVGMGIRAWAARGIREILSRYSGGAEELAALQADFAKAQTGQEFQLQLLPERLMIYDEIQRSFTEDRIGGGHPYIKRLSAMDIMSGGPEISPASVAARVFFFHPNKAETRRDTDEFYDFFEKILKTSPAELKLKSIDLNKEIESMVEGNLFLNIWAPALSEVHKINYHFKTEVQSTPVIIAAARFKIDKGRYPENMSELQRAGYIKEITIDPFSAQPLVYKRTEDNFTLYSVGYNLEDDGGQVYRNKEGKVRLWAEEGDAVFWPVQK